MPIYKTPRQEIRFLLGPLLSAESLTSLSGYKEMTADLIESIIEEGAKLAEEVLHPLNMSGDEAGCIFNAGEVRTPSGFKEAYDLFRQAGWTGLACDTAYGGQGLPLLVNFILDEIISSANLSFGMYPGLSHGAYNALHTHASPALKAYFLPRLVDGSWSGTMCLTEPQCGTDLGLIRTQAVPKGDGSFAISGTKIFISAGEHDLTENIVHLVLARLPDAPAGVKGISLFVVPKFLPPASQVSKAEGTEIFPYQDNWQLGARNPVFCGRIEHKMGIKASATCVMNFESATGWLVGVPHKGLSAMFTMMNEARLAVALQGLGLAELAYQNAANYARERLQGRALSGAQEKDKPADPLLVHPDVRRMLLQMRSQIEPARALAYWIGLEQDIEQKHAEAARREEAADLVALFTPILKSMLTDLGSEAGNLAVQVYGGHGYVQDHGMEQIVRDARICQIYEGANGIQALDLVGRKLPDAYGRRLRRFFHPALARIEANLNAEGDMGQFAGLQAKAFAKLQQATVLIAQRGLTDAEEAAAAASDYLRLFGLVAYGDMWLRMLLAAKQTGEADLMTSKTEVARFFFYRILPDVNALFLKISAGKSSLMRLSAESF